ncbi:MAG: hypothetical protein CBD44_01425 [Flavobacteriaceae bacterium TMED184]|nr:MAG: hypothetical protein CBD44_01425 [Flavobacteriaceae bacterium TMED184]
MSLYKILLFFLLIINLNFQEYEIDSLIENKHYIAAEKAIINSIQQNENDELLIKKLGDCYGYMRDWDKAIIQYEKLVEIDNNNATYNYKLGGTLAAKANDTNKFKSLALINKAKKYLIKSVEIDKKNKPARWALIQIFTELPQFLGGSKSIALQYANELEEMSLIDGLFAKKYIYDFKNDNKMSKIFNTQILEKLESFNAQYDYNYLNYSIGSFCEANKSNLDKGILYLKYYIENFTSRDRSTPDQAFYLLAKIYYYNNDFSNAKVQLDNAISYYNSNQIDNQSVYREMIMLKKNLDK